MMNILFDHQNFPGQYRQLAGHLAALPGNQVVFITQRVKSALPGVRTLVYKPQREVTRHLRHYLRDTAAGVLNAQAVARVTLDLKKIDFVPHVMVGHNGWNEIWYLKDVFPQSPLLGYFEFFYCLVGTDVGFDPSERPGVDTAPRIRTKNLGNLLGLQAADYGQCPTAWQKSTSAALNLEPYRGFPSFMRSLPTILDERPQAQVPVVGDDEVSYGARLPEGQSYRQEMLSALGDRLDQHRVHFLGKLPYPALLKFLQISRVHVYLTTPSCSRGRCSRPWPQAAWSCLKKGRRSRR